MVLPIHDRNPVRRASVVTWALIAINVVAFLVSPVARAPLTGTPARAQLCAQQEFFLDYGAIPRELTRNEPLGDVAVVDQSGETVCRLSDEDKQPVLSVLFAMFLHGGWLHLLGNMLFLFVFGNNVEDRLGRLRFLVFYLACGYLASYGFALASPDSQTPLVGASGAIAGVLGAYLLLFPRAKVIGLLTFLFFLPVRLPAWLVLGSWFVLQYLYARGAGLSEGGGVAYLAHVIGFVAGAAYIALAGRRFRPPPRSAYYQPQYR